MFSTSNPRRGLSEYNTYQRYINEEGNSMTDRISSGSGYRKFRNNAAAFFEKNHNEIQEDARVPYIALLIVDRLGTVPKVLKKSGDNDKLFYTCCLGISGNMRDPIQIRAGLQGFTENHVTQMNELINNQLNWGGRPPVTPFWFILFFSTFLETRPLITELQPVFQLVVTSISDVIFTYFRPSVIALSAMLVFVATELPHELKDFKQKIRDKHEVWDELLNIKIKPDHHDNPEMVELFEGPSHEPETSHSGAAPDLSWDEAMNQVLFNMPLNWVENREPHKKCIPKIPCCCTIS